MELSPLSSVSSRVVVDTSAIINLNASACAAQILRALPMRLVVVDIVAGELEGGREKGRRDAEMLAGLVNDDLVEPASLGSVGEALFEQLVSGPASSTLDDGEAATLACAVERGRGAIVDDRKARRICKEQFPSVHLLCSVDVFRHPAIEKALGRDKLSAAVLGALRQARMRVLPEHLGWVIDVIGSDAAADCPSLPRGQRPRSH